MLSVTEEEHFKFIEAASAMSLGTVREEKLANDLDVLVKSIGEVVVETERCLPTIRW
jgi:predicted dinucleotide-utilizing enzyme